MFWRNCFQYPRARGDGGGEIQRLTEIGSNVRCRATGYHRHIWWHRQVVGPWPRWCTRSGRTHGSLCQGGNPGDLGPGLEGLGPGGSILRGGEVIAAEVEEVVGLIVGREETLGLSG